MVNASRFYETAFIYEMVLMNDASEINFGIHCSRIKPLNLLPGDVDLESVSISIGTRYVNSTIWRSVSQNNLWLYKFEILLYTN